MNYRILDWSASLEEDRFPALESLLRDEIDSELVVGADIVCLPTYVCLRTTSDFSSGF